MVPGLGSLGLGLTGGGSAADSSAYGAPLSFGDYIASPITGSGNEAIGGTGPGSTSLLMLGALAIALYFALKKK